MIWSNDDKAVNAKLLTLLEKLEIPIGEIGKQILWSIKTRQLMRALECDMYAEKEEEKLEIESLAAVLAGATFDGHTDK